MERITVKEAAQMMGISKQAVRVLMQRKAINIGFIVQGKDKKRYLIYRERVEKVIENG